MDCVSNLMNCVFQVARRRQWWMCQAQAQAHGVVQAGYDSTLFLFVYIRKKNDVDLLFYWVQVGSIFRATSFPELRSVDVLFVGFS